MNHKKRAQAAINSYEQERRKYEVKIQLFRNEVERTQNDINDFDQVVDGSLKNVERTRRNDSYGRNVKSVIDGMMEWEAVSRYYGVGTVTDGAIGRNFGDVNHAGDSGATYGIGAGAAGIGAGIGAAAGAYGLAGAIGVASTGTAIGTLGGAAATSASLAWLGGGALAAGGLGMLGGIAALTGIGLIPLAGAGTVGGVLYKRRNRRRADAIEKEVLEKIGDMDRARQGLDRAIEHLLQLGNVVRRSGVEIRVLNNRNLGKAIEAGNSDQIAQEARSLILAIHQAITEVQDLWNGASNGTL